MEKIKNWLLPGILALIGSIDLLFGIVDELVAAGELPESTSRWFRATALLITIFVTRERINMARFRRRKTPTKQ